MKLKLQYLSHLMQRANMIGKDPDAGKDQRREEKGATEDEMVGWHHWHNGHEVGWNCRRWWWTGRPGVLQSVGSQRVRQDWATELNWSFCPQSTTVLTQTTFFFFHSMNSEEIIKEKSKSLCPMMEKIMAPHSSTLAWKIPWTKEPGRRQSTGSRRIGYGWATSLSLFTFRHWRRKWQPTPVFLPGESQGRGSLVGCRLWGRTESGMTEAS